MQKITKTQMKRRRERLYEREGTMGTLSVARLQKGSEHSSVQVDSRISGLTLDSWFKF